MEFENQLQEDIKATLSELYDLNLENIDLQKTNSNFSGDFTLVVFPFLRQSKKGPEDTAKEIGEALLPHNLIQGFNVVKGFLNFELKQDVWINFLKENQDRQDFGHSSIGNGKKMLVEYSSPNTNKPLHLGHVRNNLLGLSVSKILKATGHEVVMANLINDRGIHICKSMIAWDRFGNGETPETSGLKGDHLVGKYYVEFDKAYKAEIAQSMSSGKTEEEAIKGSALMRDTRQLLLDWEAGDEKAVALWKKMNQWVYDGFDVTYKAMGVHFDKVYYESDVYLLGKSEVRKGVDQGVFYEKEDGSIWVDLESEGLDHKLLLRADGTSVYMTQDIGTAILKYEEFAMDQSIYVVGNEQEYHFKVLALILKKLKKNYWEGIYHLSYGMVDLPDGKMKSREGNVVDADNLISEMLDTAKQRTEELGKTEGFEEEEKNELYQKLGMGALKYFLLKVDAKKRMLFNPSDSIDFQGNTGPFIQYTYARISSLMRSYDGDFSWSFPSLNPEEHELISSCFHFQKRVEESAMQLNPAIVAQSIYDLSKSYNRFYHEHSVLGEANEQLKKMRVSLSKLTATCIQNGMQMLGISVPERM